jgi:protein-tyrosine phosphatase
MIDLHCHWVPGVDDGVRNAREGTELLLALASLGFTLVTATPHSRAALWQTTSAELRNAYDAMRPHVPAQVETLLGSEHHVDASVLERLQKREALPYGSGSGEAITQVVLLELPEVFPIRLMQDLAQVKRLGYRLVIAHPERYRSIWNDESALDTLLDMGAYLLLDACSLIGKYGEAAQTCAAKLLDEGAYEAACTDAHRPKDVDDVARAFQELDRRVGNEERVRLFQDGPKGILESS